MADRPFLERALELAARGLGTTRPNPMVGCVLVRDGEVVGEGWHREAGGPHAEIEALARAGEAARGATAYVTLEPCSHQGRTGPCAPRLVDAGVARVVVGLRDPHPEVDGRGMAWLRQAGVPVDLAPPDLQERCARLNCFFLKRVATGLPFVTMKFAMTLDGKIATRTRHSRWISGEASRERAHRERALHDAVMVGAGTVRADDPRLDCRLPGGRDPVPVLVDSRLDAVSPASRALAGGRALVACAAGADPARAADLQSAGAEVLELPAPSGRVSLPDLLEALATRGIGSVLLEGGGRLNASALEQGLVDRVLGFVAPVLVGGAEAPTPVEGTGLERVDSGHRLRGVEWTPLGEDLLVEGFLWNWDPFVHPALSAEKVATSPSSTV